MGGTFKPGYTRPGQLWKSFFIEPARETLNQRRTPVTEYVTENPQEIRAILTSASPRDMATYQQAGHPVSHVITHRGPPMVKAGDRLICGNRAFYVQGVTNSGELGIYTLYYCEERKGAHNGRNGQALE